MAKLGKRLNVRLVVINDIDSHPTRSFDLEWPTYQIRVGRGSQSGSKDLFPARHNAWFESRVMSRSHAILHADPETKRVFLEDIGSMHGTHIDGQKLKPHTRERVWSGDYIKFGAEVTRGPESFPPLELCISYEWLDTDTTAPYAPKMSHAEIPRNSFSVPEDEEDDEVDGEFVQDSVTAPKIEVVVASRTYSVPESDLSCAGSFTSEDAFSEPTSPETSAIKARSYSARSVSKQDRSEQKASADEDTMSHSRLDHDDATSEAQCAADLFHEAGDDSTHWHQDQTLLKNGQTPASSSEMDSSQQYEKPVIFKEDSFDEDLTESDDDDSDDEFSDDVFDVDDDLALHELAAETSPEDRYDEEAFNTEGVPKATKLPEVVSRKLDNGIAPTSYTAYNEALQPPMAPTFAADQNTSSLQSPPFQWDCTNHSAKSDRPSHQSETQKSSNAYIEYRAPSPSDAAMAKSSSARLTSTDAQQAADFQSPYIVPMTSDFRPFPSGVYSYGNTATPVDVSWYESPYNQTMIYEDGPFTYNAVDDFQSKEAPRNHEMRADESALASSQSNKCDVSSPVMNDLKTSDCLQSPSIVNSRPTTRVAIDDILERESSVAVEPRSSRQGLKRKADDISDHDQLVDEVATEELHVVVESTETEVENDTSIAKTSEVTQNRQTADEPARKRVKTDIAKYAAVAFAGAVVGGIGTVAALVALPPTFFA